MNHEEAVATMAVEAYALGFMTEAEREAFEEHYFGCFACAKDALDTFYFVANLRTALHANRSVCSV